MSDYHYGVNVLSLLNELAAHDTDDIHGVDFEVDVESPSGASGFATVDIPTLAEDAAKMIVSLQQKLDAAEAKIKQLEWDSVFIPKNIESALAVVGMALPESKEEFNFHINRWIQCLVDRVVRLGPELDAERNNLRAEGAMAARNHIRKTLTAFNYEHHGVVAECADMAEMVAQRLRSGTHDTADKAGDK